MSARILPLIGTLVLALSAYFSGKYAWKSHRTPISPPVLSTGRQATNAIAGSRQNALPERRPETYYTAIVARPLFQPSRRPAPFGTDVAAPPEDPTGPEPAKEPPTQFPEIVLLGVILSQGNRSALISVNGGSAVWIELNKSVDGWKLSRISAGRVKFVRDNQSKFVDMYK